MNPASSDLPADRRIVVTGVGLVTPLGAGREASWRALVGGEPAARPVGGAAAPVSDDGGPRAVTLALLAAREALADAGRDAVPLGEEWGCTVSGSKPLFATGVHGPQSTVHGLNPGTFLACGLSTVDCGLFSPDAVPSAVARAFGVGGPVMNVASACATGLHAAMIGAEWIRDGRCKAALVGAAESSLHPLYTAGFERMGVLSASGRVRPFDRRRDGFVIGEGAAVLVLESLASARRRGAPIHGEFLGWDFSSDASHATRFNSGGRRMAENLARALRRAGVDPAGVDYVNAHGTATPLNDPLEVEALQLVFGGRKGLRVSSTKGATGHLLGATGAVELAFCLLALRDDLLPPTLNLADPLTDRFDFLPDKARPAETRVAATVSFGFGGALGAMVLSA